MIIAHRINTLEDLQSIPDNQGIEFDIRDSNGKCIVCHDAFEEGVDLEVFLRKAGNRYFIVNIKSEGIETRVLELLKHLNYDNFFLLDCSFPKIIQLTRKKERRIAVRFSEYESIDTVLTLANDVEWVWVDCFTKFPLTKEIYQKIRQAGMKICLVSPDLQKQPEKIKEYIDICLGSEMYVDAICCKFTNKSLWEKYYELQKEEFGILHFHQGWTDIINSSALIHYYAKQYATMIIILVDEAADLFSFITRQYSNILFITVPRLHEHEHIALSINAIRQGINNIKIKEDHMHIIGLDDAHCIGKYQNAFRRYEGPVVNGREHDDYVAWKKYYSAYDIPYIVRANYFEIQRDLQAEQLLYEKTIKHDSYILTHFTESNGVKIKEKYLSKLLYYPHYELHRISSRFFDAILILKGAKEIHVIDSVWAAICYHLDMKYRMFSEVPITVYCIRDYQRMFERPILLPNWRFIPYEA
jgi:hypothetical protein